MYTKQYGDLFKLIQSLAGVGTFATSEKDDINNFINRRFEEAYNRSPSWPRYQRLEERTVLGTNPVSLLDAAHVPFSASSKTPVDEFIRIYKTQPFLKNSALEYDFTVDSNGANLLNASPVPTTVFALFKARPGLPIALPADPETSTVEIPSEFFYFIAHGAYADFLRMDGQTDKGLVEEQIAEKYLATELEKIDIRNNNNNSLKKFSTYVNRQSR